MKRFFHQTYYFWLITRIIFIAGGLLDSLRMFGKGLEALEVFFNVSVICYLGLMIYNTVNEFRNTLVSTVTKYIVGGVSLVLAFVILVVVVNNDSRLIVPAGLFVIWIIFLGIFDLSILNRTEEGHEEIEAE